MKKIIAILILSINLMGMTTKEEIINNTLSFEGKKLGNSMRGIELSTLNTYNKLCGTNWKLNNLTHSQAMKILSKLFWSDRLNYINNDKVLQFIFDWQVNTKSSTAYRLMHKSLGLKPQSILSLELVAKINENPKLALKKFYNARLNYMKSLKNWNIYKGGWVKRLNKLIE
jgi:lysozyme family protein